MHVKFRKTACYDFGTSFEILRSITYKSFNYDREKKSEV